MNEFEKMEKAVADFSAAVAEFLEAVEQAKEATKEIEKYYGVEK